MKLYSFLLLFVFLARNSFAQNPDSLEAVRAVDSLIQISDSLIAIRDLDKAVNVTAAAEKIALEKLGEESAAYASMCHNKGKVVFFKGNYPEAEKWYLASLAIREKVLGKDHPDYAISLNHLGHLYQVLGKYEKASSYCMEAKAILEKAGVKEHSEYAWCLQSLAGVYQGMGNMEKAERLYLESKDIWEKVQGKGHMAYARNLMDLANIYMSKSNLQDAEPLYLEANAIMEKILGKEHPGYVQSLNSLAVFYWTIGNYKKAEPLFLEVLAIREKTLGKEDPQVAMTLNRLGVLYFSMGDYKKVERNYLDAKAIVENSLGNENVYVVILNNLGMFYARIIGNYEKAEQHYLEALAIGEKTKNKYQFAISLNGLAEVYRYMCQYKKAEDLWRKAITIQEIAPDKEPYAATLNGLGCLYLDLGDYKKAEPVLLESIAIRKKIRGKEHINYAVSLFNLAHVYLEMGEYEKAEPLFLETKAIFEKTGGKEHYKYGWNLDKLALLYEKQNSFSKSEPLLAELSVLDQARLSEAVTFLSEGELAQYITTYQERGNSLCNYALARLPAATRQAGLPAETRNAAGPAGSDSLSPGLPALAYDHALFYKGFLLTAAERLNTLPAASPESEEINSRLKGYRRSLAAELAKPIAARDIDAVTELEENADAAEKELARSVAGYADAIRQVDWRGVQSALKKGEVAIEFVHFRVNFPKKTDSVVYAALLLLPATPAARHESVGGKGLSMPGKTVKPIFIPLFEAKSLDTLLRATGERKTEYVDRLYTIAGNGASTGKHLKSLYELIWQPIEKELLSFKRTKAGAGVKKIYFSPSGLLHRINLGAIPVDQDSRLTDSYNLVELSSTRQLIIPAEFRGENNDALLFGGIQYGIDTNAMNQTNETRSGKDAIHSRGTLNFGETDPALRGDAWDYLPGTAEEIAAVKKMMQTVGMKVQTRQGYFATEESFKSIGQDGSQSPRVLHLATHGFFFPDPKYLPNQSVTSEHEPAFKISDHPMIRSGLILAGGNQTWSPPVGTHARQPNSEDGILTAYEISQMNLSNTELVVLSACETGLGDIAGNEGVYGLQRAFKIAGARYLIMSLWQVPDFQTKELMTMFYRNWLLEKKTIPQAFQAAQVEMREKFEHPFFWAGFVLVE